MSWLTKKLPVKLLGLIFIAGSGISFVQGVIESDPTKSWQERLILFSSTIFGAAFVSFYWGRLWLAFQPQVKEGESLLAKLPRRYMIGAPLFIFTIVIFIQIALYEMKSAPEYKESQIAVMTNSSVIAKFGRISNIEMDNDGSEIDYGGSSRYGKFQFVVKGSVRSGRLQVSWRTSGDHFIPTEIDEITGVDDVTPIWAPKE